MRGLKSGNTSVRDKEKTGQDPVFSLVGDEGLEPPTLSV